jgi:outer membrane protein assembly factor BamB
MTPRVGIRVGLLLCTLLGGCTAIGKGDYGWVGGSSRGREGAGALRVAWRRELTAPERGAYRPVEHAVAAVDAENGRVFVGARSGRFYAFTRDGEPLYRFELHESVESEPALDAARDELYVSSERAELYALTASTGTLRWTVKTPGAVRRAPLLFRDALFVFSEDDVIEARARSDGSLLWSYKRDRGDGFLVAGHSALTLTEDGLLLAGFSDGTVVALDALDGRVKWERDTSDDAPEAEPGRPRYLDVDTTPVRIGDRVYAASFAAGLYCLDARNGSVVWRDQDMTAVTGIAATEKGELLVVSADHGIGRYALDVPHPVWLKPTERGSFGVPLVIGDLAIVGDSRGSLIAVSVESGDELGRIDAGHGFIAAPSGQGARAYVLTSGGSLLALRLLDNRAVTP